MNETRPTEDNTTNVQRLKDAVYSSLINRETPEESINQIMAFIECLSEKQAGALIRLNKGQKEIIVNTKDVPLIINAKSPQKIGFSKNRVDFGEIKYTIDLPDIADVLILLLNTRGGFSYVKKAASDQKDPLATYWRQIANIIPSEKTKRPETHTLITTPVVRELRKGVSSKEKSHTTETHMTLPKGKKKTIITTRGELFYMGESQNGVTIKPLDVSISISIYDLEREGNTILTPEMIWRQMAELPEGEKVTRHQIEIVKESIERMMTTLYEIHAEEEERFFKSGGRAYIRENMLYLREAGVGFVNGKKALCCWRPVYDNFNNPVPPILYTHALISGYISSIDAKGLQNIGVKMTEKTIPIRDALLTEIHRFSMNRGNAISYEPFYRIAQINENSSGVRAEKLRVRDQVKRMLNGLNGRVKDANGNKVFFHTRENDARNGVELEKAENLSK